MARAIFGTALVASLLSLVAAGPSDASGVPQLDDNGVQKVYNVAKSEGSVAMVRFFLTGWGWWQKQQPTWKSVTSSDEYKDYPGVRYYEVDCRQPNTNCGRYGAGAGGWPTIKVFSPTSGEAGIPYKQKTKKSMCDELKEKDAMEAYIREAVAAVRPPPVSGDEL